MKIRTLALALLAIAACRSDSGNNTPDAPNGNNPDGTVNTDDVDIHDIQDPSNKVAVGATVNVRGVVVTAIDNFGAKTGNFWIQEPGGTPEYSGVLVFKADVSQVAALSVGDLVDVTGAEKAEFALSSDTSGRTTTELEPPSGGAITVTKVGTGTVPTPADVDALAIGQMSGQAAQDAEWEKWEGVLIKVSNVGVQSSTKLVGGSSPDSTFQSFTVTGPLTVESSLAAFVASGLPADGPKFGDCEASITGIGDYFFNWIIEPRSTAELATGGSGCPAAETGAAACADTIDNDANGHADCSDYSCMLDQPGSCVKGTTVVDVNTGVTAVGSGVSFTGVFVTAIDSAKKNFWIADALAAAPNGGIEAFNMGTLPANMLVGSTISIDRSVDLPFHGLNEIGKIPGDTPTITVTPGAPGVPTAATTTLATLADATNGKPYIGSLVKITATKFTVTAVTGTGTAKRYTLSDGTTNISMGAAIYDPNATTSSCYSSITAIMTLDTSPNPSVPMILPTKVGDLIIVGC